MKSKVLSSIVYCIMDNFFVLIICVVPKKLNVTCKGQVFKNITHNAVSGIVIPELLININSCHGFVKNTKSAVILSCCIKFVDYYLQFIFVLLKNNSNAFKNVTLRLKQRIKS